MDYSHFGAFSNKCTKGKKSHLKSDTITYRFSFGGMEVDNEISGNGNSYDYGARIYNPRLGRFLSLDPLMTKYPYLSPYNFVSNSPISMVDPDGRDNVIYLVVLPDANSQLKPADVQSIANKANENFKSMGLNTRVVVVDGKGPLPPAFDAKNMDKTDAVAVIGGSRKSTAEFIKKNVSESRGEDLLNGWVKNPNLNPEKSEVDGNNIAISAADLPGIADEFGQTVTDAAALLINHGVGHNAQKSGEHNASNADVMKDGNNLAEALSNGTSVTTKAGNTGYAKDVKAKFGDNKAKDNYEKNKTKNDSKILKK
jgi:RHS repeat-associated protein